VLELQKQLQTYWPIMVRVAFWPKLSFHTLPFLYIEARILANTEHYINKKYFFCDLIVVSKLEYTKMIFCSQHNLDHDTVLNES